MDVIEFDVTEQLDTFNKLSGSMNFIVSTALNDVAFERARATLSKEVNEKMTIRNKAMGNKNAIKFNRSTKDKLKVTLYYHLGKKSEDIPLNKRIGLQQFGGIEKPKNRKLAIPIRKNLATYAGVKANEKIPARLTIQRIMQKAKNSNYKTKGIKPFILKKGVFIRTGSVLKMIYSFSDKATHNKKLLRFQKVTEDTYSKNLERFIERNYLKILKG